MSLEPVGWLCRGARDLPNEVKRQIAYCGRHPTAYLVKELKFEYGPVAYEPLSKMLYIQCPYPTTWLGSQVSQPLRKRLGRYLKSFWICRSIYNPHYSELPAWVVDEVRSSDQYFFIFKE